MKPLVILLDMDSVIADFVGGMLDLHFADTGERLAPEAVSAWDFVFSNGRTCMDYFGRPGFFRNLRPIPGAVEAVDAFLDAKHEVLVVSSATLTNAPGEKYEWLSEHFPRISRNNVFFASRKGMLRGDVMIDDHVKNVTDFLEANPHGRTYTLKYTYNENGPYTLRADHWHQIRDHVLSKVP